ncbi:MAG: hypothetical protein WKF84_12670 [Pyrinomonadaceae bacterium]
MKRPHKWTIPQNLRQSDWLRSPGNFGERRVVVVGDLIADQFLYGEIARVSREALVFILRHEHTGYGSGRSR